MSLIVELIKYLLLILLGLYTYFSFCVFRYKNKRMQEVLYRRLSVLIFIIHFVGYFTLFLQAFRLKILYLYGGELLMFLLVLFVYQKNYPKLSKLMLRNMIMLLSIGFIMLTRISFDKAVRQFAIVGIAFLICLIIPFLLRIIPWLNKLGWVYGTLSVLFLLIVLALGVTNYGATNWLNVGGLVFQPSEIVKILFVFSIAAMFYEGTDFKRIITISIMAAANVLILVFQRDLGGALLFFVTYVFMLYVATAKPIYLFAGLSMGSLASFIAYQLFNHVRVRVMAWQNPFRYIDNEGYQISQSLFAIGTGGWFGLGLNRGLPTSIPVVASDFIFSAISEELGGLFALFLVMIFLNCFILLIQIALKLEDAFYRLLSLGFSVMFAFQVILSIGGVIKFIPSTGVTLPFISYGGSSVFSTILMFMILQGIYIKEKSERKDMKSVEAEEVVNEKA